jgi:hypothetical protein
VRILVASGEVRLSAHGYEELAADHVLVHEVVDGLKNAVVVGDYPEFAKGPCALVLEQDSAGKPVHVLWGIPKGHASPAVLITAYRPDPAKWDETRESEALQLDLHRGKGDKLLLTKDDSEKLIASYEARRGPIAVTPEGTDAKYDRYGYFYLIQLVPEALPNRVKLGFADSVDRRLGEHRTAAPTARLLKSWPCKRSWDFAAMDCITRTGCKLVLNEVYEGDIQGFIDRAGAFFALMPNPDNERELSEHSPLYDAEARDESDDQDAK